MQLHTEKTSNGFLLRLRKQDTPTGVSNETVEKLAIVTGLTKTEVVHLALRELADRYLPKYELDDGDLTDQQLLVIREISPATQIPDNHFSRRLFDE